MSAGGGFIGAFGFVAGIIAAGTAFVAFPAAYLHTWPWLTAHVLGGYGPWVQDHAWWIWGTLLMLVIFGIARCILFLLISAGGLVLALRIIFGRGRR